jgi:hypothetical protein
MSSGVGAQPCASHSSLAVFEVVPSSGLFGGDDVSNCSLAEPGLNSFATAPVRHLGAMPHVDMWWPYLSGRDWSILGCGPR